ncbi:uncharacterized protein [Zea mays]|uniref:uncharacterized protein isoform X4 n=1 Tax=Zea mays TaxID=4577 RepID=UPI0009AAE27B|nr:uncharacterized protein LOC109944046 isoform X4 [Zea mays]|eukprot:XP_020404077.1 uncharacterized protein LOC109944046 isoform X4 [Zea mays]
MADPTNTPSDGDPPQHRKTGVAAAAKNIAMPNVDDDDDFEPPKKKCNISMDAPNKTQLYYLDHLHHAAAPNNKNGTPRIKYFNKNIIRALSMADKRKPRQGGEPFGVCPFRSSSETCYVSKSPTTCQIEFPMRPKTFDEDPNQHDRLPNIIIQLPLMQDLMANKIQMLPVHQRQKFQATLIDYDLEVGKIFASIKQCLNTIGTKQSNLAATFGELIDEVLRANESVTPNTTVVGGTVENDSGPVFDKTPIGSVSAPGLFLSELECARALRAYLCSRFIELDRNIIDFGEHRANCCDIQQSFADGACLDNVFMQCFIECVRDDWSKHIPPLNAHQLILDVNVGAILNFEEQEQHSKSPRPFDPSVLESYLLKTLPSFKQLDDYKSIMVPMLRSRHWTLYVVNLQIGRIHVLDSNPYGPEMGGTIWKNYHCIPMDLGDRKVSWARLMMSRLNLAIQNARPRSALPAFLNYPIELMNNCPTMKLGSNDCGFFVMRYMQNYDYMVGAMNAVIDPDYSEDIRSLVLHYLIFHRLNRNSFVVSHLDRFKFSQ